MLICEMGLTLPISWGKDGPADHVYFLPSSSLQCAVPVGIQHTHSSSYYFYKADRSKASMGTGCTSPFATHRCVYQVRIYLWLATGGNKAKPVFKSVCLLKLAGLPWWLSGEESPANAGDMGPCLEGVPDLPVAPQDEAGLTKTFQTWPRGWLHIPEDPDSPLPS